MPEIDTTTLLAEADAELARRSLLDFGRRMYPGFEAPPHLQLLAGHLEDVEAGRRKRLLVNLPFRMGKSVLLSQLFPAWYLGRNATKNIIIATHGAELSDKNSRAARGFVASDRYPFVDVKLSADSTAVNRWNLSQGGGCYAVGVAGNVVGRGADVLICDDLHHGEGSENERRDVYEWYRSSAYTRLEPGGAVVMLGTRQSETDIFGEILGSKQKGDWTVVRLPGLAEEGDPLGRKPGAALWPARFDEAALKDQREALGQRAFESQVMQNPLPAFGNLVKAEWLSQRYTTVPSGLRIVCGLDAAAKTGIQNDYSAIAVFGSDGKKFYLLDVIRRKVDFPDLRRMLLSAVATYSPSDIFIEDTSNAVALIQDLKRESGLPIIPVKALGTKISRVEGICGQIESGNVLLPADSIAPAWLPDFLHELLGFPSARHDDMVDAFTIALTNLVRRNTFFYIGPIDGFSVDSSTDPDAPAERCFEYLPDNVAIPNEVQG